MEIPGVNTKRSRISRSDWEKTMWNFHGSWFSALEIPAKSATQFCGISRGEASCCMEFQSKVTNLKTPGVLFKKLCPQIPLFGFSGIAQWLVLLKTDRRFFRFSCLVYHIHKKEEAHFKACEKCICNYKE